jgi:hypothetical protein
MARVADRNLDVEHPAAASRADRVGRADWRGWIGVAWVVGWGSAYALMAIQARAPQLLNWAARLTGNAVSP